MDRQTLDAHKALWGQENRPVVHDLPCLTPEDRKLFDELRDNRLGVWLVGECAGIDKPFTEYAPSVGASLLAKNLNDNAHVKTEKVH